MLPCSVGEFRCDKPCQQLLQCGLHRCEQVFPADHRIHPSKIEKIEIISKHIEANCDTASNPAK